MATPAFPMRRKSFKALWLHGFHRVDYSEWGDPDNPRVLVCVHGLTRNSRDFDALADALCKTWRVVCPDVAGRGTSEWLAHKTDYGYPLYLSDMAALIARTGAETVDWVGTSMGGIIGMMLAAQAGTPIRKLVMNDVGSIITAASLQRLAAYVGKPAAFDTLDEAETYFRKTHHPFGRLTDSQWRHMAVHGVRKWPDGKYRLVYDPAIAGSFTGAPMADVDMSFIWNGIRCPVLAVRGAESDLLLPQTLALMKITHPALQVFEVPGCGHAPALMDPGQIAVIREFLEHD
jgi:pimeloyl-ACP methyl ester carboxylesterase